jgi:hypothetical protein
MARKYEGSPKDIREDTKGAKRLGVTLKAYEKTSRDKREDLKGQKKLGKKS